MKLKLFEVINDTMAYLSHNEGTIKYVQKMIIDSLIPLVENSERYLSYASRLKSRESIKNKIINNSYYLEYKSGEKILSRLTDLIGITINCLFLSDEISMFDLLSSGFSQTNGGFAVSNNDNNLYLDIMTKQPLKQKNGFDIIRVDGYYIFNELKVNFEVQIKSLTHGFWSQIEHEVVYKNNHLVVNDSFIKGIMNTIKSNLDNVNNQLELIDSQMRSYTDNISSYNLEAGSFKLFLAKSINDIFSLKLRRDEGINIDIKKCSSIIAHYIYINDLLVSNYPQQKVLEYIERFNYLKNEEIPLTQALIIDESIVHDDKFYDIFYKYFINLINVDFDWHLFFVIIFALQPDGHYQNIINFIKMLKNVLVNPTWYQSKFKNLKKGEEIKEKLIKTLAETMTSNKDIKIIYEENLQRVLNTFNGLINRFEEEIVDDEYWNSNQQGLLKILSKRIKNSYNEIED